MWTKKTKGLLNKIIAEKRKYWERYRYLIQETFKNQNGYDQKELFHITL